MMAKFAEEIRNLDVEMDRKQRNQENLDRENVRLAKELDDLRVRDAKYTQMRISLEEETQRRVNAESEADRIRHQLEMTKGQSSQDIENLRRALDDLRLQNDENI